MTPVSSNPTHTDPGRPILFTNARIIDPAQQIDEVGSLLVIDGKISALGSTVQNQDAPEGTKVIDCKGLVLTPGLIDMQVYVGEPGFEYRENLASASKAAAAGGITTIITMPDTDPVIDEPALVDYTMRRARDTAIVRVRPMAAISKGLKGNDLAEIGLLREAGAVGFTDGRRSLADASLMRRALSYAKDFDALISHHVEDATLAANGVMNEGLRATMLGLSGIPAEAEVITLERDLRLAALSIGKYHAASVSTSLAVEVLERAKDRHIDVSSAVSINNITLNENDIGPYRTFFKLSPPLRREEDRERLVEGIANGTIDIIVSSHDPQDVETKRQPFSEAANGAIGLETMLSAALRLYHNQKSTLPQLIAAMTCNPARRLQLESGTLKVGAEADIAVIDIEEPWLLNEKDIRSRSKNTPFEGARFQGRTKMTFVAGHCIFDHCESE